MEFRSRHLREGRRWQDNLQLHLVPSNVGWDVSTLESAIELPYFVYKSLISDAPQKPFLHMAK